MLLKFVGIENCYFCGDEYILGFIFFWGVGYFLFFFRVFYVVGYSGDIVWWDLEICIVETFSLV